MCKYVPYYCFLLTLFFTFIFAVFIRIDAEIRCLQYSVNYHSRVTVFSPNSSGDEIANVNFLYDDIVHVLQNTIDSYIPPQIDAAVMCGTHVYQIQ